YREDQQANDDAYPRSQLLFHVLVLLHIRRHRPGRGGPLRTFLPDLQPFPAYLESVMIIAHGASRPKISVTAMALSLIFFIGRALSPYRSAPEIGLVLVVD
ncbi:MAG: hypothetical protein WBR56_06015, partial [Sedimenticolaceae bacterium]